MYQLLHCIRVVSRRNIFRKQTVTPTSNARRMATNMNVAEDLWRNLFVVKDTSSSDSHGVEVISKWWDQVKMRYSEKQRFYHTLAHIDHMCGLLQEHEQLLDDHDSLVLATIFHDIIYDPKVGDNEEQSAEMFKDFASETNICDAKRDKVVEWILMTKQHKTEQHLDVNCHGEEDIHYFLDFDMEVLGWGSKDYKIYAEQIRKEYQHIPSPEFETKRAQVLRNFLRTPKIFATQVFYEKCEQIARENIRREIADLERAAAS